MTSLMAGNMSVEFTTWPYTSPSKRELTNSSSVWRHLCTIWEGQRRKIIQHYAHTKTYHHTDHFAEQHAHDDHKYMLDHFYSKLLKHSDAMTTKTGSQLSQHRTAFMLTFLHELQEELDI